MAIVRRVLVLILLVGCGRLGFSTTGDALGDDGGGGDGSVATLPGLVVWFQFDNDNGMMFIDSISDLRGTCNPPGCPTVTTMGHRNSAYVFDGVDDCILVPDAAQFRQTEFTLAVWGHQRTSGLLSRMSKQLASQNNSWQLGAAINNSAHFLYNTGTNDMGSQTVPNSIVLTDLEHLAATFGPAGLFIYVNGVKVITEIPAGPVAYDLGPAGLGCTAHLMPTGFFDGTLDEIQIYNRALTDSEVMQLSQQ